MEGNKMLGLILIAMILLPAGCGRKQEKITVTHWDHYYPYGVIRQQFDDTDTEKLQQLREKYSLDQIIPEGGRDLDRLSLLCHWVTNLWSHHGSNTPRSADALTILEQVKEGDRFRCVEYAIVLKQAAQSLGYPARILYLMREDVAYSPSGAGHVVTEIWSEELEQWIFFDGQWGVHLEVAGRPLSGRDACYYINQHLDDVEVVGDSSPDQYLPWIKPYFHYYGIDLDNRIYDGKRSPLQLLFVPQGSQPPLTFQGHIIGPTLFTQNNEPFIQPPFAATHREDPGELQAILTYRSADTPAQPVYHVHVLESGLTAEKFWFKIDEGQWFQGSGSIDWNLQTGTNRLYLAPAFLKGGMGREQLIEIDYR